MKKACLLLIALILLLTSCSLGGSIIGRFSTDDKGVANARFEQILKAIKSKDKNTLKGMFSKKALTEADDMDGSIVKLFDFFQGEVISYDDWGGPGVDEGRNDDGTGRNWNEVRSTYDVITNQQKYRFAIKEFAIDTSDRNNIGIYSLYVIKFEDSNQKFAYGGDGKWTPGIVIDQKKE